MCEKEVQKMGRGLGVALNSEHVNKMLEALDHTEALSDEVEAMIGIRPSLVEVDQLFSKAPKEDWLAIWEEYLAENEKAIG